MIRKVGAVHHRRESGVDAGLRFQELLPGQALDVGDAIARQAELLDELVSGLRGVGLVGEAQGGPALDGSAMEQTFGADASAIGTRPAPAATRPASPALITLRRDRFTVRVPVSARDAMGISSRG
jgi:hypothetical protein